MKAWIEVDLLLKASKDRCVVCGEDRTAALDFHHVDPSAKGFNLGSAARSKGIDAVRRELAKCVPVCAVCHRLIHSGEISIASEEDIERAQEEGRRILRDRFCAKDQEE